MKTHHCRVDTAIHTQHLYTTPTHEENHIKLCLKMLLRIKQHYQLGCSYGWCKKVKVEVHLHVCQVKHVGVKCLAQGHNNETMSQY